MSRLIKIAGWPTLPRASVIFVHGHAYDTWRTVLYARTRNFIARNPSAPEAQEGSLDICPLPPIRSEQSLNVVPKLIRIAAIGLVALIGYKGVQALIAPPPPID